MDLINRQDAIDAVNKTLAQYIPYLTRETEGILLEGALAIKRLPSAQRTGKWKAKNFHECFCDNCGFTFDIMKCDFLGNMKHCPNCGARMVRGEEDEID